MDLITAGFVSVLSALSISRSESYFVPRFAPRYAEFFLVALPVIFSLLYAYKKHVLLKLSFWGMVLFVITGHISFMNTGNFEIEHEKRLQIKNCVSDFYFNSGSGRCLTMDNRDYSPQLLKAKELRLHFVENLQKNSPH